MHQMDEWYIVTQECEATGREAWGKVIIEIYSYRAIIITVNLTKGRRLTEQETE